MKIFRDNGNGTRKTQYDLRIIVIIIWFHAKKNMLLKMHQPLKVEIVERQFCKYFNCMKLFF